MTNYEVVEFMAIVQRLIDKYNLLLKGIYVQALLANKEIKRKLGLHQRFLLLN